MSGITSAGFELKTEAEILAEVQAELRVQFGSDIDLSSTQPLGILTTVFCNQLFKRWEGLEDVYYSLFPNTSEGASLERVVAFDGLSRKPAIAAIVELEIFGSAGTVVTNGFQAQTAPGVVFETAETVTIAALAGFQEIASSSLDFSGATVPAIASATYDLDVTIDGGALNQLGFAVSSTDNWDIIVSSIQTALRTATGSTETVDILSGRIKVSSATLGVGSTVLVADGTLGSGGGGILAAIDSQVDNMTTAIQTAVAGAVRADADARALVAGSDGNVSADTITTITTPVAGVTSVNNREESIGGAAIETDVALRARYQAGGSSGGSSVEAIQAALNDLDSVIIAKVYENNTDAEDAFGVPPHAIEVVVDGGTDEEIGGVMLNSKAAGIETFGTSSTTVVDSEGITRTFKFSRSAFVDVWVDVDITSNAYWDSSYSTDVKDRVAEVVGGTSGLNSYAGNGIGADVLSWQIIANMEDIEGIEEIAVEVGLASPPGAATVAIDRDERARTEDAKIVVTVT